MTSYNRHGVLDAQQLDYFVKNFFQLIKRHKSSPLLALCVGNSSVTGGFPSQRPGNAESVSMAWLLMCIQFITMTSHEHRGISNYRQLDCLIQVITNKTPKLLHISVPFWWESTGDRWIPLKKDQYLKNSVHVMTSLCTVFEKCEGSSGEREGASYKCIWKCLDMANENTSVWLREMN